MTRPFTTAGAAKRQQPEVSLQKRKLTRRAKLAPAAARGRGPNLTEPDYKRIFLADPIERIEMVKAGVPAAQAKRIIADLDMPLGTAGRLVRAPISTLNRKAKKAETLAPDIRERFLGLAKLIGQVQAMIDESGDRKGFDAKTWTARWLAEPLPDFGGVAPLELMDTMEGQALVSATLARIQTGA